MTPSQLAVVRKLIEALVFANDATLTIHSTGSCSNDSNTLFNIREKVQDAIAAAKAEFPEKEGG